MKILIVEDDDGVRDFLRTNLTADLHVVDTTTNGTDGSFLARTNPYDIIILDYSLPEKNGIQVCQEVRAAGIETPILFLTVIREINKKVSALDKGADDYMVKPFSFEELRARVQALGRRPRKTQNPIITAKDLTLDTNRQIAKRGSSSIYLTRKEYSLLEYLMQNKGTVVSRAVIMEHVWNANSDPFSNTVEAHILNLRKKLHRKSDAEDFIKNIPGRGYIIDAK